MLNKGMTLILVLVMCFMLMAGAQAAVSFELDTQTENHAENTETEVPVQVAGSMGTNEKAAADGDWDLSLDLDEEEDIPDEIKGIIGTDDRVMLNRMQRESWPNCAVTYLALEFPSGATGHGTGFMIGPSYVLTCGHCVYDEEQGGWATKITVAPGSNGSKKPYGETTATQLFCMDEWYYYEESCYDLGMIRTRDPIGNKCGWLGYYCPGDYELNGYAKIVGYGSGTTVMYEAKGYLNGTENDNAYARLYGVKNADAKICYTMDTLPGASGSPLMKSHYGEDGYAIGVHNAFTGDYNTAVRFTSYTVSFFADYFGK